MPENIDLPKETRPTIFLIEEDDNVRPGLTNKLRQLGYRVLVAADFEDAIEWVSGEGYIHADLVLIDLVDKTPKEMLSLGRGLRHYAKYDGHTPLVVMPERVAEELAGTDLKVSEHDWICYYEDPEQLQNLIARLLNKSSG